MEEDNDDLEGWVLQNIIDDLKEENPNAVILDGLDKAILGVGGQYTKSPLLIYSHRRIIETLMENNDWDPQTAEEWYDANIGCLWAGEGTPIILED